MCNFHGESGWPKDAEVAQENACHTPPKLRGRILPQFVGLLPLRLVWAPEGAHAPFALRQGLMNFLDTLPRVGAESGSVVMMVEGPLRSHQKQGYLELEVIAGTCWSPRPFDAALCCFGHTQDAFTTELLIPFEISWSRRDRRGAVEVESTPLTVSPHV